MRNSQKEVTFSVVSTGVSNPGDIGSISFCKGVAVAVVVVV